MKIIDISQEVFGSVVYPGDPHAEFIPVREMSRGSLYNLSAIRMSSHNGTHVDAPAHFIADGKTVDRIETERFVGDCCVVYHEGDVTEADARAMLAEAERVGAPDRLLIGGNATVTLEAAKVFAEKLLLLGNESVSVGPVDAPLAVHLVLLGREVVLLEGIRLNGAEPGRYLLNAAPLNLGGAEGAPCRAWLMRE